MLKVGLTCCWLAVPLSFIAFNPSTLAAGCGPGPHWVDQCPKGTDHIKNHWATMKLEMTDPATGVPIIVPLESLQGSSLQVYRRSAEIGPVTFTTLPIPTVPATLSEIVQETFGPIGTLPKPPAPHNSS